MNGYVIHLRPTPDADVPDAVALRRLLKVLLRSYGLVAIDVREVGSSPAIPSRDHDGNRRGDELNWLPETEGGGNG